MRRKERKKRKSIKFTLIAFLILIILSVVLFFVLHNYANTLRPKPGYGGELTPFLLPFIVWAVKENIKLSLKKGNGET